MKAIIAKNNLSFIGLNNKMLWRSKDDFKHFKEKTLGSTLLVGYNTNTELPPLKDRKIIVDDRNGLSLADIFLLDIDWCIGGKKTYERYCHLFTELHISHIDNNAVGDTMFPNFANLNPNCRIFNYYFNTI